LDWLIVSVPAIIAYAAIILPPFVALGLDPAYRRLDPNSREAQRQILATMQQVQPVLYAWFVFAMGLPIAYFTLFHGWKGQTPGKVAVRIKVVQDSGERVSYVRALIRYLVAVAFSLLFIPWVIEVLWPLWDRQKQAVHDKAAGTIVVRV